MRSFLLTQERRRRVNTKRVTQKESHKNKYYSYFHLFYNIQYRSIVLLQYTHIPKRCDLLYYDYMYIYVRILTSNSDKSITSLTS